VQLHEVIIEKANCQRIGEFKSGAGARIDFSVRAKTLSNNQAYVYLRVKIIFAEEPKVFSLDVIVRGKLVNEKTTNRSMLKRFAETNGLPLLLPWAREIVASLTRRMGIPSFNLPLINVFETISANEKRDQNQNKE